MRPYQDVEFLLEKGDWHWAAAWSGPGGATPLHLAVLSLNVAVAEALLEVSSVNVNAIDERGETPLDQLARWSPKKRWGEKKGCLVFPPGSYTRHWHCSRRLTTFSTKERPSMTEPPALTQSSAASQ